MEIYCLKCKIKTETNELTAIVFKNGVPAVKGKCAQCGTLKFLITRATIPAIPCVPAEVALSSTLF